jgi:phosphoglycolate phosphatase
MPTPAPAPEAVLFDFDGPLCGLFAKHSPAAAADPLVKRLRSHEPFPRPDLYEYTDPHALIREAALDPGVHTAGLCRGLDDLLTQEEITAAASAELTDGAAGLVAGLLARGVRLAVVSNNNAQAVRQCLLRFDLLDAFEERIVGRPRCGRLMKPHRGMVDQAVTLTGVPAGRCVLLGDSAADAGAARAAGVPFLGYARNERKAGLLEAAGAHDHVPTLADAAVRLLHG